MKLKKLFPALFFFLFVPLPAAAQIVRTGEFKRDEIVVKLLPGRNIHEFNERYSTAIKEQMPGTDQYLLHLPPGEKVEDKLREVETDEAVASFSPNYLFQSGEVRQRSQAYVDQRSQAYLDGQSPVNFYGQASLSRLRLAEAQQFSQGWGVRVAVIDTGIDLTHPLFAGRLAYPFFDFVDQDDDPSEAIGGAGFGHGTFVAGLIVLTAPRATIMPLRAFDRDGIGSSFNIAKAIRYAADHGAHIINMSFGLDEEDDLIEDALEYAYETVYMVAAAGNDNRETLHFPAKKKSKTLSVTSTDAADRKADFANFHEDVKVAAPGVDLYSAYPGNRWALWSGTSFSTALVTGEAALLLQVDPAFNRSLLNTIISNSGAAIDYLNPEYRRKLGRSRIDFLEAVNRALNGRLRD